MLYMYYAYIFLAPPVYIPCGRLFLVPHTCLNTKDLHKYFVSGCIGFLREESKTFTFER